MDESGGARLLVFIADGRQYGCALRTVREIVPYRVPTRLPGAPAHIAGLINLRGRLVTVVDLAVHLGVRDGEVPRTASSSIVLVESGPRVIGLVVDEVRDVRPVGAEAMEPMAESAGTPGVMRALARFDDGVAVVLDADAIVGQVLQ
jgi:purine-binding chemotaxis protein CheW